MRLVADIESDHFLEKMTKIHCIAVMNADNSSQTWVFGPEEIDDGVALLQSADELIFHNGITFDVPAIQKLYPEFSTDNLTLTDTLVLSRLSVLTFWNGTSGTVGQIQRAGSQNACSVHMD